MKQPPLCTLSDGFKTLVHEPWLKQVDDAKLMMSAADVSSNYCRIQFLCTSKAFTEISNIWLGASEKWLLWSVGLVQLIYIKIVKLYYFPWKNL